MAILLRSFMFLGIITIFLSIIAGMGTEGNKPHYSQYMMIAGLIFLGLWVGGGILAGFFAKNDAPEPKD